MDKTKDDISEENISPESEEKKEETKDEIYPSVFLNHNPSRDLNKLRGKIGDFSQENKKGKKMTRLHYDVADREVREALRKGIQDYKRTADKRAEAVKHDRATSAHGKKSDLRKLGAFGRV